MRFDHNRSGVIISCHSGDLCAVTNLGTDINNVVIDNNTSSDGLFLNARLVGVYNVTIYGGEVTLGPGTVGLTMRNNIFLSGIRNQIGPVSFTHSSNMCSTIDYTCEIASVSAASLWADPANADFRLCTAAGQPTVSCPGAAGTAIDAGLTLGVPFNKDAGGACTGGPGTVGGGTARPQGAGYDIGACEAGSTPAGIPTPIELVARYSCDNVVTDSSGQGNHGTLTNGATYNATGKYNQACSFDGVNDYVSIPDSNSLDMTTGFTIAAWVKATNNIYGYIVSKLNTGEDDGSYWLANTSGFCGLGGPFGGFQQGTDVSACHGTVLTNVFTHLAITYEAVGSPNLKLYKNGVEITNANVSTTLSVGTGILTIGMRPSGEGPFTGLIDEIWIYKGAVPLSSGTNACTQLTDGTTANDSLIAIMNCPINVVTPGSPIGLKVGGSGATKIGGSGVAKIGG